jgi:two-component system CheB/CheR fusion protein
MTTHKKDATKPSKLKNDSKNTTVTDSNKIVSQPPETDRTGFPVVGIGASAGGLAAFEAFFSGMPANSEPGMAFILVQHLAPDHTSILSEIIQRYTRMQVFEVEDGMQVQINCTYIIPPNRDMALLNGNLQLIVPAIPRGHRLPIDFFFRSLAQDQHEQAIGIILSGTGSDGTLGAKAIKAEGGIVLAQEIKTAEFDGMPRNIIATGLVDYIMPPAKMPAQIIAYTKHLFAQPLRLTNNTVPAKNVMNKIFILLRNQTGHDFSLYKPNTICRRIERRMTVHQIDAIDFYLKYLQQNPAEVTALFNDLLIGVTSFFRDPNAFLALEKLIIPELFTVKSEEKTIRIWSTACSTGEEAYSIAILFQEYLDLLKQNFKIQIFATDIDREAIAIARAAFYPANIALDISPERLARFFILDTDGNGYRVNKTIRDMLIFSEHNVIKDPPFSRLDLISCRNLLIYMSTVLQNKLIPLLHYALNPGGILFLGSAETLGEHNDLFMTLDPKAKIYKSLASFNKNHLNFMPSTLGQAIASLKDANKPAASLQMSLRELTENAILQQVAPASALVNENGDILYLHGRAGMFLEPAPGESSINNILKMAREGLLADLTISLKKAIKTREIVFCPHVRVKTNSHFSLVNLTIRPVNIKPAKTHLTSMYLITLEEDQDTQGTQGTQATQEDSSLNTDARIIELKNELKIKEDYIQAFHENMENTNQELKCSNEEMQSINEELQSSNEELETSKEELQSVNEELGTVNAELQAKLLELSQSNNDMNNLLAGTGIATIFLDLQLRILRFTSATSKIMNLILSDIGRPVSHLALNLINYDHFLEDTQNVLTSLNPKVADVQTSDEKWFTMRIQPYRTIDNVIEGVVITFAEITEIVHSREALRRMAVIIRDAHDAIIMQKLDGTITAWNSGATKLYGWSEREALTKNIRSLIPNELQEKELSLIQRLSVAEVLEPYHTHRIHQNGTLIPVSITATALVNETGQMYAITTTERGLTENDLPRASSNG